MESPFSMLMWVNEMYATLGIKERAITGDIMAPHLEKILHETKELAYRMASLEK